MKKCPQLKAKKGEMNLNGKEKQKNIEKSAQKLLIKRRKTYLRAYEKETLN